MSALALALLLLGAQEAPPPPASAPTQDEDDLEIDALEPDHVVVNVPTTARLPRHQLVFRLTHRFARGLSEGDFGDLTADLFGLDGGAQIGLELRFGLTRSTQLGVYRTSDRTLAMFLSQGLLRQGSSPVTLQMPSTASRVSTTSARSTPPGSASRSRADWASAWPCTPRPRSSGTPTSPKAKARTTAAWCWASARACASRN